MQGGPQNLPIYSAARFLMERRAPLMWEVLSQDLLDFGEGSLHYSDYTLRPKLVEQYQLTRWGGAHALLVQDTQSGKCCFITYNKERGLPELFIEVVSKTGNTYSFEVVHSALSELVPGTILCPTFTLR